MLDSLDFSPFDYQHVVDVHLQVICKLVHCSLMVVEKTGNWFARAFAAGHGSNVAYH